MSKMKILKQSGYPDSKEVLHKTLSEAKKAQAKINLEDACDNSETLSFGDVDLFLRNNSEAVSDYIKTHLIKKKTAPAKKTKNKSIPK